MGLIGLMFIYAYFRGRYVDRVMANVEFSPISVPGTKPTTSP